MSDKSSKKTKKPSPPVEKDYSFTSASTLLDHVLGTDYFLPNDAGDIPIPFQLIRGATPLILVLGENAAGKSFFRRVVQGVCSKSKTECITFSMEARRKISYMPWLTLVYGDEESESTGVNSARMVQTGISTCLSRDNGHVVFWDEPDVGLSDGFAAGVGVALHDFAIKPGKHTKAAIVVTHSRALVEQVAGLNPTYLHLGTNEAPPTLEHWLNRPIKPQPIEELFASTRKRFKLIQTVLDNR